MVTSPPASPPRLIDVLADPTLDNVGVALSAETRFRSPYADYEGHDDVAHLVGHIRRVVADVRPVHQLADDTVTMTAFEARVGHETVQGMLLEEHDAQGRTSEAMLTVRPYAALRTSMRAMQVLLEESPLPSRRPA